MRWPWQCRERRDSGGDFSDAVLRLIEAQAAGTVADASSTAATRPLPACCPGRSRPRRLRALNGQGTPCRPAYSLKSAAT